MLSGCLSTEPSSDPMSDRAAVSGELAAKLFVENCYNSPDGAAVLRNPAFKELETGSDRIVAAQHKSVLADFQTLSSACFMTFQGNKSKVETRADFANALNASVTGKMSVSRHGSPLSMTTPSGKIHFGNAGYVLSGGTPHKHPQEFEIWFQPTQ